MKKQSVQSVTLSIALFLALELLLTQLGWFHLLNWGYQQFGWSSFWTSFAFKMGELVIVLLLNRWITHQSIYYGRRFALLDYAFWLALILIALPFLPTKDLVVSLATGAMGGLSEEFLARGVLLGKISDYLLRERYSAKRVWAAIALSNLVFALMHLTNLSQEPLPYVLAQSALAFISGLAFSVIYLQTGSIWYPVALHFMDDFVRTAADTAASAGGHWGMVGNAALNYFKVFLVLYALFAWRKKAPALLRRQET
ncbi:CPBP family intramembrane metalloprotease [Leuconostocaceae bacterium ESL0958]|nr:CPBP family intramembrane metalloprotease [Leuconostocaceae bacterium ESL0958]